MIRHWFFDWSGTLADDLDAVVAASNHVLTHFGSSAMTREEFRDVFRLPFSGFYQDRIPTASLPEIQEIYLSRFTEEGMPVTILPGALRLLECLRDRGDDVLVVSSAPLDHITGQAARIGVDHLIQEFHGGVMNKPQLTAELMKKHGFAPENCAFVGDMTHDILAGNENGILSVALLTGYQNAESLMEARPSILAQDLPSLLTLMGLQEV